MISAVSRWLLPIVAASLLVAPAAASDADELLATGDAWWARRAEGQVAGQPAAEPIDEAVSAYTRALAIAPDDLTARWKLLRALFFEGHYRAEDRDEKLAIFERARDLAEAGLDQLARRVGGRDALDRMDPEEVAANFEDRSLAAETYFWAAVHWGLWGEARGKLAAARQGVAGKVRDYAERVIALDETIENAGGHRILGRLHSEAPRIPFITGWIDREKALAELERTREIAPGDLLTRVYRAEALLEHFPRRSDEALADLRRVAASTPDPDYLIEELRAVREARELLAEHAG